jgi:hypothetical protein
LKEAKIMSQLTSIARVATTSPARYMGQLCKHFVHKIPASYDAETGRIEFPFGLCELAVGPDLLVMSVSAADDESLGKMEDVIARHLERFAFREPPQITWKRGEN